MQISDPRVALVAAAPVERRARPPLIVFSQLRWGLVPQRQQHLLVRLARDFQVHVVEQPVCKDAQPLLVSSTPVPGVEVLTPCTRVHSPGFNDDQRPTLRALLADFTAERGIVDPLVWTSTSTALPLVVGLDPRAVIYDCMDEPASAATGSRQLANDERALMKLADIVLTSGASLHDTRDDLHPNVHCLPSVVDAAHFCPDRLQPYSLECAAARALHEGLPRPRIGFFGVIDDRVDHDLLASVADLRPEWQIVMVGPVIGVDPAALPRRANIHWLGLKSHDLLPYLQAHWDVCMLPLAGDEGRFVNPAKTLECLAGGKPVVSTPSRDVETLCGDAVRIAETAPQFVDAVQAALLEGKATRDQRLATAKALIDAFNWDDTAARIRDLMLEFVRVGTPRRRTPVVSRDGVGEGAQSRPLPVVQAAVAPLDLLAGAAAHPGRLGRSSVS